jgi:hypothetical protein
MRVNIYAEELDPNAVEIIEKTTGDGTFTGVRIWLYLPATLPDGTQHRGPFVHRPGDDDSSAVTFWGKRDLEPLLEKALKVLRDHRAANREATLFAAQQAVLTEGMRANRFEAAPDMRNALTDLMRQVSKFCEEQGEAEFYTGNAMAALGLSDNEVHLRTLADLRSQSNTGTKL